MLVSKELADKLLVMSEFSGEDSHIEVHMNHQRNDGKVILEISPGRMDSIDYLIYKAVIRTLQACGVET